MKPSRWLASAQLERAEGGAEALELLGRLTADERRDVLERGEPLAEISLALAQAYALRAPRARRELGAAGFTRWAAAGVTIATEQPASREAALAYFRVDPATIREAGAAVVGRWLALVGRVSETSRRLGVLFLERTGDELSRLGSRGAERLDAFAAAALRLAAAGWRGEFLAAAFLGGAATLLRLSAEEISRYVELGLRVQSGRDLDQAFFQRLPVGFGDLGKGDRRRVFEACQAATAAAPRAGAELFAKLPAALGALGPDVRSPLARAVAHAGKEGPELVRLLPLLPAIVRALPAAERAPLFERLGATAARFPSCLVPALRSLPRAREAGPRAAIEAWIERGEKIAEDSLEAGRAFFALESRSGIAALREASSSVRFGEVEGVLRSYARLLARERLDLREASGASLRPFLDVESLRCASFALPGAVGVFDTWEENFTIYKLATANGVGRILHGTFELELADVWRRLPRELAEPIATKIPGKDLADFFAALPEADPLIGIFVACEGARIDRALRAEYRGYDADLRHIAAKLFRLAARDRRAPSAELLLFLLGAGLRTTELARLTSDLDAELLETMAAILLSPAATAADALAAAILLRERLADSITISGFGSQVNYDELFFEQMVEAGLERAIAAEAEADESEAHAREIVDVPPEAIEETDEEGSGVPLSAEELRRLLQQGAILKVGPGSGAADSAGIFMTGLELAGGAAGEPESENGGRDETTKRPRSPGERAVYEYDEWDFQIRDYRSSWCRLEEIPLGGDAGEFFQQALSRHSDLLPEVRRQFQRIRPERYRRIRGLEDGEDFDLNAAVEAHVDLRTRRTPSSRLYVARRREERDVATLFLVDMSASTDEALASEKEKLAVAGEDGMSRAPRPSTRPRRIIDVAKESLVVMAEALEEIGDQYAIYGFSGEGRQNVEVYRVKRFSEGLTAGVRGRIGAIEPKRSTRMGTALRHAILKLQGVASRSKHILLLSDGFPQDFDYGADRRSNAYGIADTMMALQECQTAGITPFCITVDKTGHDYLRQMCETSRYLVIEDVEALPVELPKIYERWVQG